MKLDRLAKPSGSLFLLSVLCAFFYFVSVPKGGAQQYQFEPGMGPEWSQPVAFAVDTTDRIFVATQKGNLYSTTDPTTNWQPVGTVPHEIWDIVSTDDGILYVATEGGLYGASPEKSMSRIGLMDTTTYHLDIDAKGTLWIGAETGLYHLPDSYSEHITVSTPSVPVHTVETYNQYTLAITSDNKVFLSHDQGETWEHEKIPVDDLQNFYQAMDMLFANDTTLLVSIGGFGVSNQGVWRWQFDDSPQTSHSISDIWVNELRQLEGGQILAAVRGRCSGESCSGGGIYQSLDGGQSWHSRFILDTPMEDVIPVSNDHVLAANIDQSSSIAGQKNGWGVIRIDTVSNSWRSVNRGLEEAAVSEFETLSDGTWLSAIRGVGVVRSVDGGRNWSLVNLPTRDSVINSGPTHQGFISSIDYANGVAFVSRYGGLLHRSFNEGTSWDTVHIKSLQSDSLFRPNSGFYEVEWLAGATYVAVGSKRYYISRDSGKSWSAIDKFGTLANHRSDPLAVDTSRKLIYAIQDAGSSEYDEYVVVSRDSGKTWRSTGLENQVYNLAVSAYGDVAAYSGSGIYLKEAASDRWEQLSSQWELDELNEVLIGPDSTLYAAAKDGFWTSDNSGKSWKQQSTLSGKMITDLILGQDQKLYLLSKGVWQSEQQVLSKTVRIEDFPNKYKLKENFPNPFNPTTQIEFSLPRVSDVTLTVYDMLGRRVAILVDGKRQAGQYSVTFDAGNLSSGMYIYRLKAGEFTESKTMILVK